jgi:hypothetical protein
MRSIGILLLLWPILAQAQVPSASLDTAVLRIGEQVELLLTIDLPTDAPAGMVSWPVLGDTLINQLEVVRKGSVDSVQDAAGLHLTQRIFLTSFDTGHWAIPPFTFVVSGSPRETRPLLIEVRNVALDDPKVQRPAKTIYEVPFSIGYWIRAHLVELLAGLGALVLIIAGLFYLTRKRKTVPAPVVEAPMEPVHLRTLRSLRELDASRLWQQGEHKAYHSRITDLLRSYIEERYQVPAMESSTDELLQELGVSPMNNEQRTHLENMLRLADLVKFAKAKPTPAENEQMMAGAIRFVEATLSNANTQQHVA